MKQKKLSICIAIVLSIVTLISSITLFRKKSIATDSLTIQVRTVELSNSPEFDAYLEGFEKKTLTSDEETVTFYGKTNFNQDDFTLFDNVAVSESEESEKYHVTYNCTFSSESMQFTFIACLLDENENIVDEEEILTDAFITETGGLDAYINLDGETFLISELVSDYNIDNCKWGFFKGLGRVAKAITIIVVVIVVVAETAEQIRAKQNYKYNKNLEANGNGVDKGNYITGQNRTWVKGYNAGNYHFGFTTFANVGCEVAAVYNLMLAIGKPERLSETIYNFEKWLIEFCVGFGFLGSNPKQISTYLNKKGIKYKKITNYKEFKLQANNCQDGYLIMSRWNESKLDGLHTFYIRKINSQYIGYNWNYLNNPSPGEYDLDKFNDGSGFIVGYLV